MKINKRLTSYPILMNNDDDYVDSYFDASLNQSINFNTISLSVDLMLSNDEMIQLINDKRAAYVVHVECPLLSFRDVYTSEKSSIKCDIDLDEIANSVEVSTFVVALEDFPKYYNKKFNWEYGTDGIDISKGNIMAIGPTYTVDINRAKDGLKKLSDIIQIKEYSSNMRPETSISIDGPVIIIYTNKLIKDKYFAYGREYLYNTISMIMVPAMQYVLTAMKSNSDNLKDYRWYNVIEQLLNQNGIEVSELRDDESGGKYSIYELSQKIFKAPLEKGILELSKERG